MFGCARQAPLTHGLMPGLDEPPRYGGRKHFVHALARTLHGPPPPQDREMARSLAVVRDGIARIAMKRSKGDGAVGRVFQEFDENGDGACRARVEPNS